MSGSGGGQVFNNIFLWCILDIEMKRKRDREKRENDQEKKERGQDERERGDEINVLLNRLYK